MLHQLAAGELWVSVTKAAALVDRPLPDYEERADVLDYNRFTQSHNR